MKLVRPFAVTVASLTSSVPETPPANYAGGTTYALNALASVATGTARDVYRSLQSGNTGHTPSSSPTWWVFVARTYVAWDAVTAFALNDLVVSTANNRVYKSVQASNTNHPVTDVAWWADQGVDNRWKMFDKSVNSQSSSGDDIVVAIQTTERVDTVAMLNVSAVSARVQMTDAIDGIVFDETYSLVSDDGITDWWSYFFEPISRRSDLIVSGLPPYDSALITVTLEADDAGAAVGALVLGLSTEIGTTSIGASVGIVDYSRKEQDAFGNYIIVERAFSKRANFTVYVERGKTDYVQNLLASYRATPILYIGSEEFGATAVYGFYKDFDISIDYLTHTVCSIQLEGVA